MAYPLIPFAAGVGSTLLAVSGIVLFRKTGNRRLSSPLGDDLKERWIQLDKLMSSLTDIHKISSAEIPPDDEELCRAILDNACQLMNSPSGSLMLVDKLSQNLKIVASKGVPEPLASNLRLRPGEGIAGLVLITGETIISADPLADSRFLKVTGLPEQPEPFVSVPVKTQNRVIGVLNLHTRELGSVASDYSIKLLTFLADKAAITIENAKLHEAMRTYYLEMVETLTRVIDAKDSYTHDHGARARMKARRIAAEMKLPDETVTDVEYAALLHDIGKIGIKESILQKPSRLTDAEYLEIKQHPSIGYQILHPAHFLSPVSKMVLHHHEWYNGKGYPEGLAGREIPIGARIVSIIDAWDAMVSDRPYRKAIPKIEAVKELKKGRGIQFDPDITEVYLNLEGRGWDPQP